MEIKSPEHLAQMLDSLILSQKERKSLHRDLSNKTRRYFRGQIRKQRDIEGVPYAPRKRRKGQPLDYRRNMLMGLSRMLMAHSDEQGFSVGLSGLAGFIGEIHNQGKTVSFPTRINGWFNKKTNRWEGGKKAHLSYRMTERTFLGWTAKIEQEIAHDILNAMEPKK